MWAEIGLSVLRGWVVVGAQPGMAVPQNAGMAVPQNAGTAVSRVSLAMLQERHARATGYYDLC